MANLPNRILAILLVFCLFAGTASTAPLPDPSSRALARELAPTRGVGPEFPWATQALSLEPASANHELMTHEKPTARIRRWNAGCAAAGFSSAVFEITSLIRYFMHRILTRNLFLDSYVNLSIGTVAYIGVFRVMDIAGALVVAYEVLRGYSMRPVESAGEPAAIAAGAQGVLSDAITIRPAAGHGDFDQVFKIAYQEYLANNYIRPRVDERLNHYRYYNWNNRTTVLVAVEPGTGQVIGAISVTQDREKGWPATLLRWVGLKAFPFENDFPHIVQQARASEDRLAGLWRLVVRKDYQKMGKARDALFYAALDLMWLNGIVSFLFVCNGKDPEVISAAISTRAWRLLRTLWNRVGLARKPGRSATISNPEKPRKRGIHHADAYMQAFGMQSLGRKKGARGFGTAHEVMMSYLMLGRLRQRGGGLGEETGKTAADKWRKWQEGREMRIAENFRQESPNQTERNIRGKDRRQGLRPWMARYEYLAASISRRSYANRIPFFRRMVTRAS